MEKRYDIGVIVRKTPNGQERLMKCNVTALTEHEARRQVLERAFCNC